jgi:methionyl aminopeptidase
MRLSRASIEIKTPGEIALMREAGLVVAQVLRATAGAVEPGISTAELDAIAEREIAAAGATPSFKGYYGYPATICTSVNNEIVHGIPSRNVLLHDGDVISIDAGAIVGGWHGDAAVTVPVGEVPEQVIALLAATELALWHGLAAAVAGQRLSDVSCAVETSALASGPYGIVQDYSGHFIGSSMHMDPAVPNYGRPGRGPVLTEGMAMAIEPMLVLGRRHTRLLNDGWTVVTADGSIAAHFEHTVAITADGPWVTTAYDGGASGFAKLAEAAGRATARSAPDAAAESAAMAANAPPTSSRRS